MEIEETANITIVPYIEGTIGMVRSHTCCLQVENRSNRRKNGYVLLILSIFVILRPSPRLNKTLLEDKVITPDDSLSTIERRYARYPKSNQESRSLLLKELERFVYRLRIILIWKDFSKWTNDRKSPSIIKEYVRDCKRLCTINGR